MIPWIWILLLILFVSCQREASKRPPAKRVALNSPHSGEFKAGTSVLTSLGSRTTGRASGLKINQSVREMVLRQDWRIRSSEKALAGGDVISTSGCNAEGWTPSSVPSTVLAALVKNGTYADPYFGRNMESIAVEPFRVPWWYRTTFQLKDEDMFRHIRLIFEGVNYSADVWLNGRQVASADTLFGAFRMFELDLTGRVCAGENVLAVLVHPPQPGDLTIGFVDWNPRPPDENMGLWREVRLRLSGGISLEHPVVRTDVDTETLDSAVLTISADLVNRTDKPASCTVEIDLEDCLLRRDLTLEPGEIRTVIFDATSDPALRLVHPRLWWPNGMGDPNLYTLSLRVTMDGLTSDTQDLTFGIRKVEDYLNDKGHRGYKINGQKVLIRGGGWVDDLMLADDEKKIEAQIRYVRHMNLNTIRLEGFWGLSQILYDLADQMGILIMPGWSCHWEWEGYLRRPVDRYGGIRTQDQMDLAVRYLEDQVLWLRNHPSVFVWVLGSDMLPRPELERRYRALLDNIDPTRPALAACSWTTSDVSGPTGVKMSGPYAYVTPNYWTLDTDRGGAFGFNTETGPGAQPPPIESLKRMLPAESLWPVNADWNYHCCRNEFDNLDKYLTAFNARYGPAQNVDEFAFKAQTANYEAMRAMFEAFTLRKHNATGLIQWMLNSAWPAMFWQLYDWYLMPNGAFYGTRVACQPVTLIYNYGDQNIYAVSSDLENRTGLNAEMRIFDIDSHEVFRKNMRFDLDGNTSERMMEMPDLPNLSATYFLDLRLIDADREPIARNFYWLSTKEDALDFAKTQWHWTPNTAFADFTALNMLPKAEVIASHQWVDAGDQREIIVTLQNPSGRIAFFLELNVYQKMNGQSVLPILWEDNDISLLPGETRVIRARFDLADLDGSEPAFRLTGWNMK